MSVVTPFKAIEAITTASDPRKAILDFVGDTSGFEVGSDRILVGIFMRPEKTRGGIIRPDANKEEDVWQGKVGLVLKLGPNAFINPDDGSLYEQHAEVGEWVCFKVGDGWQVEFNKMPCRVIKDSNIVIFKIKDPMVWL
jgi:co-chaperonin GroES (HSP10)